MSENPAGSPASALTKPLRSLTWRARTFLNTPVLSADADQASRVDDFRGEVTARLDALEATQARQTELLEQLVRAIADVRPGSEDAGLVADAALRESRANFVTLRSKLEELADRLDAGR